MNSSGSSAFGYVLPSPAGHIHVTQCDAGLAMESLSRSRIDSSDLNAVMDPCASLLTRYPGLQAAGRNPHTTHSCFFMVPFCRSDFLRALARSRTTTGTARFRCGLGLVLLLQVDAQGLARNPLAGVRRD